MSRKNEAYISELTYFGLMKIAAPDLRARLNAVQGMRNQANLPALISHAAYAPNAPSPRTMYPHPPLPDLSQDFSSHVRESGPVMSARQAYETFAHHGQGSSTDRQALANRHMKEQGRLGSSIESRFGQTPDYHAAVPKMYAAADRAYAEKAIREASHLDAPTTRMGFSEPASYELKNYYK